MDDAAAYCIVLRGELSQRWIDWFDTLTVEIVEEADGPVTTLCGSVADQAALRGMLCKLWDLNLTVISVVRLDSDKNGKTRKE